MDMIEYTDAKRVEERRRCILCGKDIVIESCEAKNLIRSILDLNGW